VTAPFQRRVAATQGVKPWNLDSAEAAQSRFQARPQLPHTKPGLDWNLEFVFKFKIPWPDPGKLRDTLRDRTNLDPVPELWQTRPVSLTFLLCQSNMTKYSEIDKDDAYWQEPVLQ